MNIYDFVVNSKEGKEIKLSDFKGKVLLIVNTASKCGFTPQYKELQALYEKYGQRGLAILAFPCNQFMNQEPGSNEEIANFCSLNYGVTFPVFAKVDVNGRNAHPLFQYLRKKTSGLLGGSIKWNFTKFLVDKKGKIAARYSPMTQPSKLDDRIEFLLKSE